MTTQRDLTNNQYAFWNAVNGTNPRGVDSSLEVQQVSNLDNSRGTFDRYGLWYAINGPPARWAAGPIGGPTTTPAPNPKHLNFTFDTIGQTIYRSIGHCRLPLRPIWALGVEESGEETVSNTQTFAAALCAPLDPDEEGEIFSVWDSNNLVMNEDGAVIPLGWSDEDAALLATSIAGIVIYPGNEFQMPDPKIVADKGASRTNAFRGLRYVVFPDYPIQGGGGNGLPNMSAGYQRTSPGKPRKELEMSAVEFGAGSS